MRYRQATSEEVKRWTSAEWQQDGSRERPIVRIGHQEFRLHSYDDRSELATVEFMNGGMTLASTPPDEILVREE
jgi:hypothetical protein